MNRINNYEVVVGNIGAVLRGHNAKEASDVFSFYRKQVKEGGHRAESPVTLFKNGEIDREYNSPAAYDHILDWAVARPQACVRIAVFIADFILTDEEGKFSPDGVDISGADLIEQAYNKFYDEGLINTLNKKCK